MKYVYIVSIWLSSYRVVTHKCAGEVYGHYTDYGYQETLLKPGCTQTHTAQVKDYRDSTIYFYNRKEAFKCFNTGDRNKIDSVLISK